MQLTRNESVCYGISTNARGQRLLVTIPLYDRLEGAYESEAPADRGVMRFDKAWVKQIIGQIPLQEDVSKPTLAEATCREQALFCCSVL